ncbi:MULTISPECIES: LacI family DNA-binding transcriptional regulator [Vagococcus]|uniref:Transcriptional regulator KdgR, KDG operon repressor n=1 Tax=Vagococcus fluvialis bH819 TaxID=1255619 RepID=A0A1X6WLB3_9ENTE|nr:MULTISPECIES: LacI family DNA-binding transcriptional regulator [Vagococcus]SLM85123.1 Transcriptional regulator KdgR, KDG operon repressor [Vagococcus fluvialis bH819]HCM88461.1 LacI family transcriptional regulator [Vagococcus sp.]
MKKNVTISDVAKQAEVSKTTISRYLNGHFGNMSSETKDRIEQVISELNYRPNRQAQALKSKRSFLIGVIVSDISNMYSSLLLKGIGEVLGEAGYQMIIMDAANSIEKEQDLLHKLIDQSVEGIILQPSLREASHYQFIKDENIPLLLVDRGIEPLIFPLVTTDNETATKKMIKQILDKQYERVVVVSEPLADIVTREIRYHSIKEVVETKNCLLNLVEVTKETNLNHEIEKCLKYHEKTAIFASNGKMLMEILTILITEKIELPDEIGITGFDDWNLSALVGPGITSIEQQTQAIGNVSGTQMLSYLEDETKENETKIVSAIIRTRNSI